MKLVQESIEEVAILLNGKGKDLNADDVDRRQLLIGIAVEKEHSTNKTVAMRIALDHLSEDPEYYTKLITSGIADEKEAIDLYNKFYKN